MSCNSKLPYDLEQERMSVNTMRDEVFRKHTEKDFDDFESMIFELEQYKQATLSYKEHLAENGYEKRFNQRAEDTIYRLISYYQNELQSYQKHKKEYERTLREQEKNKISVEEAVQNVYNAYYETAREINGDYSPGRDGKIHENKPCFNCSGEGYTYFINPVTGEKGRELCVACDGLGHLTY